MCELGCANTHSHAHRQGQVGRSGDAESSGELRCW